MGIRGAVGLSLLCLAAAGCRSVPPQNQEQAYQHPSNLQVLKGMSPTELQARMEAFNGGLGVGCEFCHQSGNYADDGKDQERVARRMIAMTDELNRANFDGRSEVTCYTCHNGHSQTRRAPPGGK